MNRRERVKSEQVMENKNLTKNLNFKLWNDR